MVLAETTGSDPTIYYLHGLGLVAQSDGTATEYFVADGLGSVRQLLAESGDVLLAQTFDPYGNPYQREGAQLGDYGFAGEQTDANGLVFLRARYYAPGMGRFLNTDPSRQEMNPYQYARSNPVMFTDPSGFDAYPQYKHHYDFWRNNPVTFFANLMVRNVYKNRFGFVLPLSQVYADVYAYYDLNSPTGVFKQWEQQPHLAEASVQAAQSRFNIYGLCAQDFIDNWLTTGFLAAGTVVGADAANTSLGPEPGWNPYPAPKNGPGGTPANDWVDPSQVWTPQSSRLLPPPGPGASPRWSIEELSNAARVVRVDPRQGLTEAGRALQKHGNRARYGAGWAQLTRSGTIPTNRNRAALNAEGQYVIDSIIMNPATRWDVRGQILQARLPNNFGARWNVNTGDFITLLDPTR